MPGPTSNTAAESPHDNEALEAAHDFVRNGDYEGAIRCLKRLLNVRPQHEIANGLLGSTYAQLGMADRAFACFERVLATNPSNALARFQIGLLHFGAGCKRQALAAWEPLLAEPDDFVAHCYSAAALLQLEEPRKARPLLEQAARRMPKGHALEPQVRELLRQLNG